jgi:ribosomal protein S12 methylthiotransferase accessory factor YcaO
MADVEWRLLPALWPQPAVWTDVGELMLLVFTQDGVPTWEVSRRAKAGSSREDLIASGKADTFKAAKAAALFEARARSSE